MRPCGKQCINQPFMSDQTANFAEARELQWTWKTAAMESMAVAVCRLAIASGNQEFSANDLPPEDHGGTGICGSIFKRLARDEVISAVGTWDAAGNFAPRYVANPGGNPVRVWRLKSHARALRLIEMHSAREDARPTELKQAEFAVS